MSLAATFHGSKQDLLLSGASALSMGGYSDPQSWGTRNRSCPLRGPKAQYTLMIRIHLGHCSVIATDR